MPAGDGAAVLSSREFVTGQLTPRGVSLFESSCGKEAALPDAVFRIDLAMPSDVLAFAPLFDFDPVLSLRGGADACTAGWTC